MKKKVVKTIPDKIPPRIFKVFDPIFRRRIYVLLNHDQNSYVKFLNRQKIKDADKDMGAFDRFTGFSTHIDNTDGTQDFLILLKEFNWTIFHQGTLIHEITHIVVRIFALNNIPFNVDTQEFIAHSIARIYEDIAHKLLVIIKKK